MIQNLATYLITAKSFDASLPSRERFWDWYSIHSLDCEVMWRRLFSEKNQDASDFEKEEFEKLLLEKGLFIQLEKRVLDKDKINSKSTPSKVELELRIYPDGSKNEKVAVLKVTFTF